MFITNPGRMGDEDGLTFIILQDDKFKLYRLDGLLYNRNNNYNISEHITLDDALKQFPKWAKAWKNSDKEENIEKYKYLYMGFGNGLSIDKSVYNEFKSYLDEKVQEYLEDKDDKESLKYAAIYNTWKQAFIKMAKSNQKL